MGSLIVTLEKLGNPEKILKKQVTACPSKTFRQVVDYLVDPKEDEYNPAYNSDERDFSQDVERIRNAGGQERFSLMYLNEQNQLSPPVTNFDKTIGEYPDAIARRTSRTDEGEEIPYDGVKLVFDVEPTGGR